LKARILEQAFYGFSIDRAQDLDRGAQTKKKPKK
jgi:hypothetical protein